MKKSLIALAALAATSAFAQSTVTIWGIADAGYANYSQGGVSKSMLSSSGNSSSQLGFKGTEDMGGGMSASFWLEAGMTVDNGTAGNLAFQRRSTIDLTSASVGAIRLGRDYTPSFWNHTVFDPFGTLGAGAGSNITLPSFGTNSLTAARTNNGISYLYNVAANGGSHALGSTGVYAQVTYALAENLSNNGTVGAAGQYQGARVGYANGPLNVAVSYAESNNSATATTKYKETNVAGSYDLGVAQLMAHWGTNDTSTAAMSKQTHFGIGAKIPMGSGYIPVSYNTTETNNTAKTGANQFAIGYVYNLSKRTALYGTYSALSNKNGGAYTFLGGNGGGNPGFTGLSNVTGQNGTGYDIGLRTSF